MQSQTQIITLYLLQLREAVGFRFSLTAGIRFRITAAAVIQSKKLAQQQAGKNTYGQCAFLEKLWWFGFSQTRPISSLLFIPWLNQPPQIYPQEEYSVSS